MFKIIKSTKLVFGLAVFILWSSCNEEPNSPNQNNILGHTFQGKVISDGSKLQDTVLSGATITVLNGSQEYNAISDSLGIFKINNLPAATYSLKIEKNLIFENKTYLDTVISIPTTDTMMIFTLSKISYDYFPLEVGNEWLWTGTSNGALIGWGEAVWHDTFNVYINITDKQVQSDTIYFHFSGQKNYIRGTYLPYYGSIDTVILDGIIEPIEGYFKERNGIVTTEFIADGSIPSLSMEHFERSAFKGGFHSLFDATSIKELFPYPYWEVDIQEISLKLYVDIPFAGMSYIFSPNIGMQSFHTYDGGNNPSEAYYNLSEFSVSR